VGSLQALLQQFPSLTPVGGVQAIGCHLHNSVNQSINNSGITLVTWNTVLRDDANFFNPATPTFVTIPFTGRYQWGCSLQWQAATPGSGERSIYSYLNGSSMDFWAREEISQSGSVIMMVLTWEYLFTAGQTLGFGAAQTSTGALNLQAGTRISLFWIRRTG